MTEKNALNTNKNTNHIIHKARILTNPTDIFQNLILSMHFVLPHSLTVSVVFNN